MDIDATIVTAHSEKQQAAPTWKKTYGFHPLTVFADHGAAGTGEPLAIMLRPGNAGSNTAADHIEATRLALAQLPEQARRHGAIHEAFCPADHPYAIGGGASGTNSSNFLVLSAPVLAGSMPIGWEASVTPVGNDISAVYAICAK